jgi:hypothetical protein
MFDGVKRAYMLQVLYIMKVIEQFGTDIAINFLQQAAEKHGLIVTREFKENIPQNIGILDTGAEIYRKFMAEAGSEISEYKRDEKSFTFLIERCPFYEAFMSVGIDCNQFLNGLCQNLTIPTLQAILKQFNKKLKIESILTKNSVEEICLERVFIKEE